MKGNTTYFICGHAFKAERVATCTATGKYTNFAYPQNNHRI